MAVSFATVGSEVDRYVIVILLVGWFTSANVSTAANWYKGTTHVHNKITAPPPHATLLLSDMVRLYRDEFNYNFIFSTPHHQGLTEQLNEQTDLSLFTATGQFDTATFRAWDGEEVSTELFKNGAWRLRHFSALGKTRIRPVLQSTEGRFSEHVFGTIQDVIDYIQAYPEPLLTILNHPSGPGNAYQLDAAEILAGSRGVTHMEVLNHMVSHDERDIEIWDQLLSAGRQMYPIGTDDAHHLGHVGNTWIVVWADDLSMQCILDAMRKGTYYVSTSPTVMYYSVDDHQMVVEARRRPCRYPNHASIANIRFIGQHGTVLKTVPMASSGTARAIYDFQGNELYVRAEVRTGQAANTRGMPQVALLPAYFPDQSTPFAMGEATRGNGATHLEAGVRRQPEGRHYTWLEAEHFSTINTAVGQRSYEATSAGQIVQANDASDCIETAILAQAGEPYHVWVRGRSDDQGEPRFRLDFDDITFEDSFGTSGSWHWQGPYAVRPSAGQVFLRITDTSAGGSAAPNRWDLVLVTNDLYFTPPDDIPPGGYVLFTNSD